MKKYIPLVIAGLLASPAFADENSDSSAPVSKVQTSQSTSNTKANASTTSKNKPLVSDVIVKVDNCNTIDSCKIVSTTTTGVLKIINNRPFSNQSVNDILKLVLPNFDFELMTRLAVGSGWNNATDEQKTKLVSAFKDLLTYTYSVAVFKFKGSQIIVVSASNDSDKKSSVVTKVTLPNSTNNQQVTVEYNLANTKKTGNTWKTYDIKIENASLVTTYRNQFSEIVDSDGIDGLVNQLQAKVNTLKQAKN